MILASSNFEIAKLCEETKNPKFETKIALFACFWARIKQILLPYLKSTLLDLSYCKILRNMKMPKFETKIALFQYFWARILKNYCHI